MRAGAALSVAYGLVEGINAQSATVTSTPHSSAYDAGQLLGAIIAGLVMGGLWLWMAAKNGAGRNWARIVSTVLFGLWCLDVIGSLLAVATGEDTATSVAVLIAALAVWIVGLTALILLWRGESSGYFDATSQARGMAAYQAHSAAGPYSYGQPPLYGQPPQDLQPPQ
jgi:protein-S-isoprenylcysteine O-methyltransferase Ste14